MICDHKKVSWWWNCHGRQCERGSRRPGPTSLQLNGWTLNHNSHCEMSHVDHYRAPNTQWLHRMDSNRCIFAFVLTYKYEFTYISTVVGWSYAALWMFLQHLRGLREPAGFHLMLHSCRVLSVINVLCSISRSKFIIDLWGFTDSGWV